MILGWGVIRDERSIALFLKFKNSLHCFRAIFKNFETKLGAITPKLPSQSCYYYTNSSPINRKRKKNVTVTQSNTLPKLNQALALGKTFS